MLLKSKFPFVFIDETGIINKDGASFMGVGALIFYGDLSKINHELREIFLSAVNKFGQEEKTFEFKFTYVKPTNVEIYKSLIRVLKKHSDRWDFVYNLQPKSKKGSWKQYLYLLRLTLEKLGGDYTVLADYLNQPSLSSKKIETATNFSQVLNVLQIESQGTVFLQLVDILLGGVAYLKSAGNNSYRKEISEEINLLLKNKKERVQAKLVPLKKPGRENPFDFVTGSVTRKLKFVNKM